MCEVNFNNVFNEKLVEILTDNIGKDIQEVSKVFAENFSKETSESKINVFLERLDFTLNEIIMVRDDLYKIKEKMNECTDQEIQEIQTGLLEMFKVKV